MLDRSGFDLWANDYDRSVGVSDESDAYPFAGYKALLNRIYNAVLAKERPSVLDIGFGTGTLAAKLYENGCEICGQDFSEKMTKAALNKMPSAHLYVGDFSKGLAEPIMRERFDFVIATYSLHHLPFDEQMRFIGVLKGLLKEDGTIMIGDVAFRTRAELDKCRAESNEDEWDTDEIYFVADEVARFFPKMRFEQISHCAGLLII